MKTIRDYVRLIENIEAEGFTQAHADANRLKLQQEKERQELLEMIRNVSGKTSKK